MRFIRLKIIKKKCSNEQLLPFLKRHQIQKPSAVSLWYEDTEKDTVLGTADLFSETQHSNKNKGPRFTDTLQ